MGSQGIRIHQRLRTRKDLLNAAALLLREGGTPTMDDVAKAAMVSRATAYRYFPNLNALLNEAPLEGDTPTPDVLFVDETSDDPEDRIDKAEAALHEVVCRNEARLRRVLAHTLGQTAGQSDPDVPARQNRRIPLIAAALEPIKSQLGKGSYHRLCSALAVFFGPEAMVVFTDVLRLDHVQARKIKSWAIRALVREALNESASRK